MHSKPLEYQSSSEEACAPFQIPSPRNEAAISYSACFLSLEAYRSLPDPVLEFIVLTLVSCTPHFAVQLRFCEMRAPSLCLVVAESKSRAVRDI